MLLHTNSAKNVRTYSSIKEELNEGDSEYSSGIHTTNARLPKRQHYRQPSVDSNDTSVNEDQATEMSMGDYTTAELEQEEDEQDDDVRTAGSSSFKHTTTPFHRRSHPEQVLEERLLRYIRRFLSIRNLALTIIMSNSVFTIIVGLVYYNLQVFYYYLWPLFWALLCSLALWNIKQNLTDVLRSSLKQEETFFLLYMAQWPVDFFRSCKQAIFIKYYSLFGDQIRRVVDWVQRYMGTSLAAVSAQMAFMREQLGYDGSFFSPVKKTAHRPKPEKQTGNKAKASKLSSRKRPPSSLKTKTSKRTNRDKDVNTQPGDLTTPYERQRPRGVAFTNNLPSRFSSHDNQYTPSVNEKSDRLSWKSFGQSSHKPSYHAMHPATSGYSQRSRPPNSAATNDAGPKVTDVELPSLPQTGSGRWWFVLALAYLARIVWANPWFVFSSFGGAFALYQLSFAVRAVWHRECTKRLRSVISQWIDYTVGYFISNKWIKIGKDKSPDGKDNAGRKKSSNVIIKHVYRLRKLTADTAADYSDSCVSIFLIFALTVCGIVFFFVFALQCAMETYTFFSETKSKVGTGLDTLFVHNTSNVYHDNGLVQQGPWWSVNSVNELVEATFVWMEPSWPNETVTARQVWGIIREFNETIMQKASGRNDYLSLVKTPESAAEAPGESCSPGVASQDYKSVATNFSIPSSMDEEPQVPVNRPTISSNHIISETKDDRSSQPCFVRNITDRYPDVNETMNPTKYWMTRIMFMFEEVSAHPSLLHPRCWIDIYRFLITNSSAENGGTDSLSDSDLQGKTSIYDKLVSVLSQLPLPGWRRAAESTSSVLTHVSAALTLAVRHFFQATASVTQFMVSFFLFLSFLYYLLSSQRDWMTVMFDFLEDQELERVRTDLSNCVQQVFVINIKVSLYHGLFTWLLFDMFEAPFAYTSTLLATVSAVIPFMPNWLVALPAACFLAVNRGIILSIFFWMCHFLWLWYGDSYMYEEMQQIHHFLVGLSILGGFYALGFQGAVIGPLLISVVSACYSLFKVYFLQNAHPYRSFGDTENDGNLTKVLRRFGENGRTASPEIDPTQKKLFVSGTQAEYELSNVATVSETRALDWEELPFSLSHSSSSGKRLSGDGKFSHSDLSSNGSMRNHELTMESRPAATPLKQKIGRGRAQTDPLKFTPNVNSDETNCEGANSYPRGDFNREQFSENQNFFGAGTTPEDDEK